MNPLIRRRMHSRVFGVVILLVAVSASHVLFCAPAHAQWSRPSVPVRFEIHGDLFLGQSDSEKAATAKEVEAKVCETAKRIWGFVDWCGAPSVTGQHAEWIVKLEVEPTRLTLENGDVIEDSIVRLRSYANTGGDEFRLHQPEQAVVLYDIGTPKPIQSPETLRRDIIGKLDSQLRDLLGAPQVRSTMKDIPILRELQLEPNERKIIIPLRIREDLNADFSSEFMVAFVLENGNRQTFEVEAVEDENTQDHILAKIIKWNIHPISPALPSWFVDDLPRLKDEAEEVVVYMVVYEPHFPAISIDPGS